MKTITFTTEEIAAIFSSIDLLLDAHKEKLTLSEWDVDPDVKIAKSILNKITS